VVAVLMIQRWGAENLQKVKAFATSVKKDKNIVTRSAATSEKKHPPHA